MPKHYVRIPAFLEEWFPGGAPSNWRKAAFDDATEQGTCLVVEYLPPNDRGVRAAVHGDSFYFEIGRDRDRADTVFLMRIERATEGRLPHKPPVRFEREFRAWPGGNPPHLDSVDDILPAVGSAFRAAEEPARPTVHPTPLLINRLTGVSGEVRARFRPGTSLVEEPDTPALLAQLRRIWARFRVDRHVQVTPRQDSLLVGRIDTRSLDPVERGGLLTVFGFSMLNSIATDESVNLSALLESVGDLPIAEAFRAELWAALLVGLDSTSLRRELNLASVGLHALGASSEAEMWRPYIAALIREAARRASDDSIVSVIGGSHPEGNAFPSLASWAARLQFAEEVPAAQHPSPTDESVGVEPGGTLPAPTFCLGLDTTEAPESSPAPGVIDDWVLRLRMPDRQWPNAFARELGPIAARLSDAFLGVHSVTGLSAVSRLIIEFNATASPWLNDLPDPSRLQADYDEARAAYEIASAVLGDFTAELIEASAVTPSQLADIAELVKRAETLRSIPSWMWDTEDSPEIQLDLAQREEAGWAARLADPACRERISGVVAFLDQVGHPEALRWVVRPGPERDTDEYLSEAFSQIRIFLQDITPDLLAMLTSGGGGTELATLRREHALGSHLQDRLNQNVFSGIRGWVAEGDAATGGRSFQPFCEAVDWWCENIGDAKLATYEALLARVQKSAAPDTRRAPTTEGTVSIEHNWTESVKTKATLVFTQPDTDVQYGSLTAPLVLEKRGIPAALSVRFRWDIKRENIRGAGGDTTELKWPDEWPQPEPAELDIPLFGWQRYDKDRYHFPFQARFPVRVPKTEHPNLEVTATAFDRDTGLSLTEPVALRWETILTQPVEVTARWRDETNPDLVREHPIGPQKHAAALIARLAEGGSVAVVAPRRFGKSTLLEFIISEAAGAGLCVTPAIVCTNFAGPGGFDYQGLWNWVNDRLHDVLGSGLPREWSGPLPDQSAFDQVRRAARRLGFKSVVLLFDEAQLFFPQNQGWDVGSRLKTLLERYWSRTDDPEKVPLLFGMIGLPSLQPRGGADLMGLLKPVERTEMDEDELKPLIRKLVPRMQTTRSARERLASAASNLLVLRALLEGLAQRVTRQRVWASFDDVVAVDEGLKKDLQAGRQDTVASFVRDVLNLADRVEDWQPVAAFPTAVALAHLHTSGRPLTDVVDRASDLLNQWCRDNQESNGISAVYSPDIVRRHMRNLEERRVVDSHGFVSGMLEAWLIGVARRAAFDHSFRDALFRGAQRQITIPPGAESVATGGEATIWRKGSLAYRVRPLRDKGDRARFEEASSVLAALRGISERREIGSPYLFDLIDIGLSSRNQHDAIQVYRWVEGTDMDSARGCFASDFVIDVGVKLAMAVRLLHRQNVIHRDICPRNIILDRESDAESIRPVLIDFGFAKLASQPMSTVFAGEYYAPEVRGPRPNWTRAADVYSLSWTLRWVLDPQDARASDVLLAIEGGLAEDLDHRHSVDTLLAALQEIEQHRKLDERREEAWASVIRSARVDQHNPWFTPVLRRARPLLVGLTLGLYAHGPERFQGISDFLNQVVESCPDVRGGLKQLRSAAAVGGFDPIAMCVALRNAKAHAGPAETDDNRVLRERFERETLTIQQALIRAGIETVAHHCRLRSLVEVLQPFV